MQVRLGLNHVLMFKLWMITGVNSSDNGQPAKLNALFCCSMYQSSNLTPRNVPCYARNRFIRVIISTQLSIDLKLQM